MKFNILTLFPEMFNPVTDDSILGRAKEKGILEFNIINFRDFSTDRHNHVDDTPFGGSPGMVLMNQPIFDALKSIDITPENHSSKIIYMSPRGKILDEDMIEDLSKEEEVTILCGHYEGVDQRVLDAFSMEEVSIGDYVLTGGELPAMVLIDSVSRFIPGVLGDETCAKDESIYSGLLECDKYTKPREYAGMEVPEVLTNGNHKLIHLWEFENGLLITKTKRPDLFYAYVEKVKSGEKELTKDELKILDKVL